MLVLSIAEAEKRLIPRTRGISYQESTTEEKIAVHNLLSALWIGDQEKAKSYISAVEKHKFHFEQWEVEGQTYSVIREDPEHRRGAGSYVVRNRPVQLKAILLQAPHAYFDKRTGAISAKMFFTPMENSVLRGLFVSSLHRYQVRAGHKGKDPNSPSDICHNDDHLFNLATASVIGPVTDTTIVQLHGFVDKTGNIDAIISSGAKVSTLASAAVAESLCKDGLQVLKYAEEIKRLGGTKNIQALLVYHTDISFIHVELARKLRDKLATDEATRIILYNALVAGLNK